MSLGIEEVVPEYKKAVANSHTLASTGLKFLQVAAVAASVMTRDQSPSLSLDLSLDLSLIPTVTRDQGVR